MADDVEYQNALQVLRNRVRRKHFNAPKLESDEYRELYNKVLYDIKEKKGTRYKDDTDTCIGMTLYIWYNNDEYQSVAKRVASDLGLYFRCFKSPTVENLTVFCFGWSMPSNFMRIIYMLSAKGSTPLARFLEKDGDHAIMWRVLQFDERKFILPEDQN